MNPDDALLAMLAVAPLHLFVKGETPSPNTVYDGYVETDEAQKVIAVPLPYVVFYSTPGYDNDARQSGDVAGRVVEFTITGVGATRVQAKWVLDKARGVLSRKRLDGNLIQRADENQFVRRDDDYSRPGGEPLFYGIDRYGVAV